MSWTLRRPLASVGMARLVSLCAASLVFAGGVLAERGEETDERTAIVNPGLLAADLLSSDLLLGEFGCIACHEPGAAALPRIEHRSAPRLADIGRRATPHWLREYLSDPQAAHPGTVMPDALGNLTTAEREEAVEDLVHWMAGKTQGDPDDDVVGDEYLVEVGRKLYHQIGCVACHDAQDPPEGRQAERTPGTVEFALRQARLAREAGLADRSVPHPDLARKTTVPALKRFLQEPGVDRPAGRMPGFGLNDDEAQALAVYLLRAQLEDPESTEPSRVAGLRRKYFEVDVDRIDKMRAASPKRTDSSTDFGIGSRGRDRHFGFEWSGSLRIDKPGRYRFFTRSDDGSDLWIGERRVVDNDGVHGVTEKSGEIELDAGEHPIRVAFFERDGGEALEVSWQGPGFERRPLSAERLSHLARAMHPLGSTEFHIDTERAARGKTLFGQLGCRSCHAYGTAKAPARSGPPLRDCDENRGCLADRPQGSVPRFAFSDSQRGALRRRIAAHREAAPGPLAAGDEVLRKLAAFNCLACHERDGHGGPSVARSDWFRPVVEADMGDEGRLPPHLDGVGGKLRSGWLKRVLFDGERARPYMATRMPRFGEAPVRRLLELLPAADLDDQEPDIAVDLQALSAAGRELTGQKGFNCINCHTYGSYASLGIPMVDLASMTRRLRPQWFRHYLLDPQGMKPGTRMPEFWPGGVSVRPEVLEGSTERQIAALWSYLSRGQSAKIPQGLKRVGMELVPEEEAIIYRHFIEGAGTRAIAVGYPEEVHLAFDANQQRLALIWRGRFLDAGKHRQGRGQGNLPPLGRDVIAFPEGPPSAKLDSLETPWPEVAGRAAGWRMGGYRLDEKRRPTFFYRLGDVRFEDRTLAIEDEGDVWFERQVSVRAESQTEDLWFRIASSERIEPVGDQEFQVDARLRIRLETSSSSQPVLRRIGGRLEILVPLRFEEGKASFREVLRW